jgi:Family of unknown function (DUF5691)
VSAWSEMERAALLGTRRASANIPVIAPDLDSLINRLHSDDAGHDLLRAAGLLDLYEQIGRTPAKLSPQPLPPPRAETRQSCSPLAAQYLAGMLDGQQRTIMPEFLRAMDAAGLRIPETLLPNMLAYGAARANTRPLILAVLGSRGRWLAMRHENWHYAAIDPHSWQDVRRVWDVSSEVQRRTLAAQLRAVAPAQGRALVESTWRGAGDHQRLHLIKQLETGLSLEDEPLLETALDDRSRLVRKQAADLLSSLPGSRFCRRLENYVPGYLSWDSGQEQPLSVSLPPVTSAMRRDGLVGRLNAKPAHVRSQEMIALTGGVPLDYWQDTWGCSPAALLGAVPDTNWPRTLATGFALAASRQQNATWAAAVLAQFGVTNITARCVPALDPTGFAQLVNDTLDAVTTADIAKQSDLLTLLRQWPGPWEPQLARRLIPVFAGHFRLTAGENRPNSAIRDRFMRLALYGPPELEGTAANLLGDLDELGCWQPVALEFLQTLRFRRDMLRSLKTDDKQELITS